MKYKQRLMPKVIAGIALLALFGGILGTGLLVLANMASQNSAPEISQDELQDFLNTLSGSASTGSEIDTQNGDTPSQSGTSSN